MANPVGLVIGALVIIVLLGATIDGMMNNLVTKSGEGNYTGATSSIGSLLPLLLVVVILAGIVSAIGVKLT